MDTPTRPQTIAAPRLTAILGLVLAAGVLVQGLFAGAFLHGDRQWFGWHEMLGSALVLLPLISLIAALVLLRRQPDPPSALATRILLLVLVIVVIVTGHGGPLAVHIPAAIAVVGIAVRQATGFVRIPKLTAAEPEGRIPSTSR